jgi:predicted cytidylate kinase
MKITVSGIVGSGKTTISKMLARKLNCEFFYVGEMMREMARERGITFQELTEVAKTDKEIDEELDRRQRALNFGNDNFVMDSRLGFYFIPNSFKVFLKVDLDEAVKRLIKTKRKEERFSSVEDCKGDIKERMFSEKLRYKEAYGIDFPNENDFDLVIDTTKKFPKEIVEEILNAIPDESR